MSWWAAGTALLKRVSDGWGCCVSDPSVLPRQLAYGHAASAGGRPSIRVYVCVVVLVCVFVDVRYSYILFMSSGYPVEDSLSLIMPTGSMFCAFAWRCGDEEPVEPLYQNVSS